MCVVYLRLGEHVQTPGAHPAVCGHSDQVVGILGADHVHAVHWVLNTHQEIQTHKHTHNEDVGGKTNSRYHACDLNFTLTHINWNMITTIPTETLAYCDHNHKSKMIGLIRGIQMSLHIWHLG